MIKGVQTLENLKHASGELSDVYSFHSVKITNSALKRGLELYRIAIDKFMGNSLISRIQEEDGSLNPLNEAQLQARLRPDTPIGSGEWVDISGLIAPKSEIAALMNGIEREEITSLGEMQAAFRTMADNYYKYEWTWAFQHIQQIYGINPSKMTKECPQGVQPRCQDRFRCGWRQGTERKRLRTGARGFREQRLRAFGARPHKEQDRTGREGHQLLTQLASSITWEISLTGTSEYLPNVLWHRGHAVTMVSGPATVILRKEFRVMSLRFS